MSHVFTVGQPCSHKQGGWWFGLAQKVHRSDLSVFESDCVTSCFKKAKHGTLVIWAELGQLASLSAGQDAEICR